MSQRKLAPFLILAILIAVGAAAYLFSARAAGSSGQTGELEANLARWRGRNIMHFRMNVRIGCFCPFTDRMPLTVEVLNGRLVAVTDSQGQTVAAEDPIRAFDNENLLTVDGIFAYTSDALGSADETTVTYDSQLGFPTSVSIDRIKQAMDDEMTVEVTDFEILP